MSESTPFLAPANDDLEDHPIKTLPANSHFKRPIRLLTGFVSAFSLIIFGLVIASIVLVNIGDFNGVWGTKEALRDLAIVIGVNFIVTTPTIFFQLPILINIAAHIAMSIVCIVFSIPVVSNQSWLDSWACQRWQPDPDSPYGRGDYIEGTSQCNHDRRVIDLLMTLSAGLGIITGLIIIVLLSLRLIALARTRFWKGKNYFNFGKFGGSGFTIQFTLSVLPNKRDEGNDEGRVRLE